MKTNETYLPLKRPSAGPFFKSTLAEIYFIIYKMGFRRISAHILAARAVEAEPSTDKTEHLTLDNNPAKGFTDARGKPTGTVTHCIVIADNVRHT